MIIDLATQFWKHSSDAGVPVGALTAQNADDSTATGGAIDAGPEAHGRATSCVDVAAVVGFRSEFLQIDIPSETIASFVAKEPSRRIGIAGIDPMMRGAVLEIEKATSLGLEGVCIAPAAQNYHPAHSDALRVYEYCERLGLPILIRNGRYLSLASVPLEYARPSALDEVARTFPSLKIVIGHLGWPWVDEAIIMAAKHANVFLDLAGIVSRPWALYNALMAAHEAGVIKKVLFGSDFPHELPERAIKRVYSINTYSHGTELPSIPRSLLHGIIERDTLSLLGLQRPGGASISKGIGGAFETPTKSLNREADDVDPADDADADVYAHLAGDERGSHHLE